MQLSMKTATRYMAISIVAAALSAATVSPAQADTTPESTVKSVVVERDSAAGHSKLSLYL